MLTEQIVKKAEFLAKKYNTRNPFQIAEDSGIEIIFRNDYKNLKGMYSVILKNRYIFINNRLSEEMKKIVCAHELGHDILHRKLACGTAMQEFALYKMDSRPEYEANIFAANLLLPDREVLDYIVNYHYDSEQIALAMSTDINLVSLKLDSLINKGYKFKAQDSNAAFLKNKKQ